MCSDNGLAPTQGDKPLSEPLMVSLLAHIYVTRPHWVKNKRTPAYQQQPCWLNRDHNAKITILHNSNIMLSLNKLWSKGMRRSLTRLFLCHWQVRLLTVITLYVMITSSNGNIFRVTGPLCGEFTGPGEFPTQRPVTRSFDVFFDLRLNKRLSKQPWGWWFETPS